MKLKTRLTIFLVVVVALIAAAISFVNYSEAVEFFMSNQREELLLVKESLTRAAEAIADKNGEGAGLEFLRAEDEFRPRIDVRVFAPREVEPQFVPVAVERRTGEPLLRADSWLRIRGQPVKLLRFERESEGWTQFVRQQVLKQLFIGALATAAATIILAGLLNLYLGRPLGALAEIAESAGRGVLTKRVVARSSDEIGQLGKTLNHMLDRVVEARDSAARQDLERLRLLELLRKNDRERTVDYLAAEFAHELGSPLNVVRGRAEMILEQVDETSPCHELALGVVEQVERISELIRRRVGRSHKNQPLATRQAVADVVHRAENLLEPILRDRGVQLEFSEEPQIAAYFEAERLLQVVTNLILTAARTSEPGSKIELRLSRIVADDSVPSQVEPGRFALLRIINPNPDPDPTLPTELTSRDEGLGLSYRLCEDIVRGLGGFIEFESAAGQGTTFSVFLPKTAATANV